MSDKLNIILDGKAVTGVKGETILELAKRHGIEIPTLCHDPRLEPFSSCFVCVVEVEGMKGMQPSCSTRIAEGMKISTGNEKVRKARKAALDLMASNHYADCAAPCRLTCPAGVDVQGYISYIEKGMYHEAVEVIKETNPLPAVCGRVCVRPCELACRRNLLEEGNAVGIDYLKRFAADQDLFSGHAFRPTIKPPTGKKVAVIGAGPGGLSAAFFLRKEGHEVDVFEAAPAAGGWLRYGIPEYRLPNDVLQKEVDEIAALGVNIHYNKCLGDNLGFSSLKSSYDALVLAIGSQHGTLLGAEGEDARGVYSGIDFLKEMEVSGVKQDFRGKKVAVVGGGNTAMDCCRTSLRCGADKVYVIYRRTEAEMPANPIEIHESKLEGVDYMFLTNPVQVNKKADGSLKSVTCLKMELGEPDASGRRRPVPVAGSEFDVEVDIILAAIGQKTDVNFLQDINNAFGDQGQLKINRWGDIEANPDTLQTGIPSVFAAGDGVTGPATLIQAIGQARLAVHSCQQFLDNQPIVPPKKEFLSKRDNFREQKPEEYREKYAKQLREEMPTLEPDARNNFDEVELGYADNLVALNETARCLECGCTEYYECTFKHLSEEYGADQHHYEGSFRDYQIDFRHPFIEIDNNKCILCNRCIRICQDVVGAKALGLVNRGFDTYVAPAMGKSLLDTSCESCGLCISACPTAAIAENFPFKPGPVKLEKSMTICTYCSVGCTLELGHKGNFVMKVLNAEGLINKDGNLCRMGKFGYRIYNDPTRITKPMLREGEKWKDISFEEAFSLIASKIAESEPDANAFFAGARLTNEEQYLIQKLARAGAKTNNVGSFHYLGRGDGYAQTSRMNASLQDLNQCDQIWIMGTTLNHDHGVAGFMVNNARNRSNVEVGLITHPGETGMDHKVDHIIHADDYYWFLKAVNHYVLSNGLENRLFLEGNVQGFKEYRDAVLAEDFDVLFEKSGSCCTDHLLSFARAYSQATRAIILFSEIGLSSAAVTELFNLAMITGRLGKTANGLIGLKEKNNSHGLSDMGVAPYLGVGGLPVNGNEGKIRASWNVNELPGQVNNLWQGLQQGAFKNLFIFGEDPVGTAIDPVQTLGWLKKADFLVVQDYFVTPSAAMANLILPAVFPAEMGGSFTNGQKNIQEFEAVLPGKIELNAIEQLFSLLRTLKVEANGDQYSVRREALSLLPEKPLPGLFLIHTTADDKLQLFAHGCDHVSHRFEVEFAAVTTKME